MRLPNLSRRLRLILAVLATAGLMAADAADSLAGPRRRSYRSGRNRAARRAVRGGNRRGRNTAVRRRRRSRRGRAGNATIGGVLDRGQRPIQPPGDGNPSGDSDVYSGGITGEMAVVLRPSGRVVDERNVKELLQLGWNAQTATVDSTLTAVLENPDIVGKELYNVDVEIARADGSAWLNLFVNPDNKRMVLTYTVPGHAMSFKMNLNNKPDPKVTADYAMSFQIDMTTDGGGNEPIELRSATIRLVHVDAEVDVIAEPALEAISAQDFELRARSGLAGQEGDTSNQVAPLIDALNNDLAATMQQENADELTPRYDRSDHLLLLELSTDGDGTGGASVSSDGSRRVNRSRSRTRVKRVRSRDRRSRVRSRTRRSRVHSGRRGPRFRSRRRRRSR